MIVDASGLVLGRLASVTARHLLKGEEVKIINAEKVIISGKRESIFREYGEKTQRGSRDYGPHFPKHPVMIFRRTVRGMLPYKSKRGVDALSRLRVYIGVPAEFEGQVFEQPKTAKLRQTDTAKYIELGELSQRLGSNF
jgi:large subunit ribosomal protein L13